MKLTSYIILFGLLISLFTACDQVPTNNDWPNNDTNDSQIESGIEDTGDELASTDDSYKAFESLAQEYATSQISSVEKQQESWHDSLNSDRPLADITSARVELLEYAATYQGYIIYKFVSSYLPNDPSLIFCVDEWELSEDGWYVDYRPRYLVFTDSDTPELVGEMRCEFSPDGYSEGFYNDLDKWINDIVNTEDPYAHLYTFEYEGVKYDLSEIYPAVNGVWEGPHIGKYVIAVGHINPDNSGYAVINTETQKIDHHFAGGALAYHSDDLNTIVYAFWNNVCALDGTVLATLELADGEYIRELTYTDDFQKIEVTISNENDDRTEAVLLPDDSVHLKDNGTSLLVSLLTTEPENNKWLMFGDCTQFSLSPDKNLIFTIYNGRYLSIGNAIMQGNEVYVPYTVLEAVGMTQTIAGGFGSNQFTFGDAVVRIPWASDYYVIENGDIYIEEKRVQLYHNDILYIPAARILEPLGFTVEYVENMPGHNSYAALIISDSNRTPSITINQAKELLNNAVYQLYATEIKKTESDLAEGRTIYSDEAFERLKADSSSVSMEYYDTYSDYYVFKLSDYPVYTYINMHNGEVYYDDRWSLPDLHISSGVMRVSDLYY